MAADEEDGGDHARLKETELDGLLRNFEKDGIGCPRNASKNFWSGSLSTVELCLGSG